MREKHLIRVLALVLGAALLGSCHYGVGDIPSVPDDPTYGRDVRPLLGDHCFVCHGSSPSRGAPSYFRLDVYDDSGSTLGAKTMAGASLAAVEERRDAPGGERR